MIRHSGAEPLLAEGHRRARARPGSRSSTTGAATTWRRRTPTATPAMGSRACASASQRLHGRIEAGARPAAASGSRSRSRSPARVIRVLLAEDQAMVRGALASLLELEPDIEVGRAGRARRRGARRGAAAHVPTSRCSTSRCPARPASRRSTQLRAALPGCRILILTTFGRPGYLRRAMESGASGFLLKDAPAQRARVRDPARGRRRARRRPGPGGGGAQPGREPADRARARGARRLARARDRRRASPARCTCRRAPSATTSPR